MGADRTSYSSAGQGREGFTAIVRKYALFTYSGRKVGTFSVNRQRAGWVLMVTGVACVVGYMLTALRGVSPLLVRVGGVLFYIGIGVFLAGVVLRYRATTKRPQ
jgi:hypothetical protein